MGQRDGECGGMDAAVATTGVAVAAIAADRCSSPQPHQPRVSLSRASSRDGDAGEGDGTSARLGEGDVMQPVSPSEAGSGSYGFEDFDAQVSDAESCEFMDGSYQGSDTSSVHGSDSRVYVRIAGLQSPAI